MIKQDLSTIKRGNRISTLNSDLIVVGGGMAGICAARNGIKVILIQDRPVLGATSHMGNNNRWCPEKALKVNLLKIEFDHPFAHVPTSIFWNRK